jgi:replicative DNA helicase
LLEYIPPHDLDAEKNVLGSILLLPKIFLEVAHVCTADDFYSSANRTLFSHLSAMANAGDRVDAVLLVDRLRRAGDLESIGGLAYIAEVAQSVAVASHAEHYARIVVRDSRRRAVIDEAQSMLRHARDGNINIDDLLSSSESALAAIKAGNYDRDPVTLESATADAIAEIDEILAGRAFPGIHSGLVSYDVQVGGFFPGEFSVIAARPSQGKTSLALQMASNCASQGYTTYFATLEMSRQELAHKRLASLSGVSYHHVRTGKISREDQRRIADAAVRDGAAEMFLHDCTELRPSDIQTAARRTKANIVFVDYLQIITPPDKRKQRYEQVGDVSKELKQIARRLCIPVVVCAQIGRQAEKDKDPRPRLHHLRESGNIENDCDIAALLWRPEGGIEGAKGTEYVGQKWAAELAVAKNRKGKTPVVRLNWDGERNMFSDFEDSPKTEF